MSRIIDLSLPLKPTMRGVSFETARILDKDGWNAQMYHLYSHVGTHMDAPVHFAAGPQSIDQIALDRCIGPAWVVDLTGIRPRAGIRPEDLGPIADKVQSRDGLLFKTGWSEFASEPKYRDEIPRISLELAQWCADRTINFLGVEPPSVADVNNLEELTTIHQILFKADIIVIEGLANLTAIRGDHVTFMAFPLKLCGGDGSPVRALAIEE